MTANQLMAATLSRLTPELIAASLLVLASLCFLAAALSVVLALRGRLSAPAAGAAAAAGTGTGRTTTDGGGTDRGSIAPGAAPSRQRDRQRAAGTDDRLDDDGEVNRRIGAAEHAGAARADRDFEYEIALAREGCGVEQLMRECGLSRVEARLLIRLYGSYSAA